MKSRAKRLKIIIANELVRLGNSVSISQDGVEGVSCEAIDRIIALCKECAADTKEETLKNIEEMGK